MNSNDLINLENLEKSLSFNHEYWDIGSYIYTEINKNPFLSLIKEESHSNLNKELCYNLEIRIEKNIERLEKNIDILSILEHRKKDFLDNENQEVSTFLLKILHIRKVPTLLYDNFYSTLKENYLNIDTIERIIEKSYKILSKQQAWNEWNNSSNNKRKGILDQIKEKGIYIKSPLWHYDKALEKVFDALEPEKNSDLFIMSSPSTYHQVLKKKILSSYQNNISQDSWDYKGKAYIPFITIPEIPNTSIIIAKAKDFIRYIKKPFLIEMNKEENILIGRGSFSLELFKRDSSAYIELYVN